MPKGATLDRREFTRQSVIALFSGVAITLTTTSCASTVPRSRPATPTPSETSPTTTATR